MALELPAQHTARVRCCDEPQPLVAPSVTNYELRVTPRSALRRWPGFAAIYLDISTAARVKDAVDISLLVHMVCISVNGPATSAFLPIGGLHLCTDTLAPPGASLRAPVVLR